MALYSAEDMDTVLRAHEKTCLRAARSRGRGSPPDCALRRLARYRAEKKDVVVMHIGRKWVLLRRPTLAEFNMAYSEGQSLMEGGATWTCPQSH